MTDSASEHAPRGPDRLAVRAMRRAARWMAGTPEGENPLAVRLFDRLERARHLLAAVAPRHRRVQGSRPWPVVPGAYRLGTADAPVAVCTLSSNELIAPLAGLPGVAIAGRLYTVNLGIERMLTNLEANPDIRALLLCGKDSPLFHTAQGVRALWRHGIGADRRIRGARGHFPVLRDIPLEVVDAVRRRVALVDLSGIRDLPTIAECVARALQGTDAIPAGRRILPAADNWPGAPDAGDPEPVPEATHGGFFTVAADHAEHLILCRHYSADHRLLAEERANSPGRIARRLIQQGLLQDPGHAVYLGGELARAETALRLGLAYEQDRPLSPGPVASHVTG